MKFAQSKPVTTIATLLFATSLHSAPVYLPDTVTGFGDWEPTINGSVFSDSATITSGVTTVQEALGLEMLPSGEGGGDGNGRAFGGNFAPVTVTYGFDTALDNVDGLILWNYSEDFGGAAFNDRGVQFADVTVTHSSGTTVFPNVEFAQTPNQVGTNSVAQQFSFGEVFGGVTSVALGNLRGYGGTNGVGQFYLGWGEIAFTEVESVEAGPSALNAQTSELYSTLALGSGETSTFLVGPSGGRVSVRDTDGFSVDSVHTVDLQAQTGLMPGTYTLINYDGSIGGAGFAGLQLGDTGRIIATLVDNTANSSVDLNVTGYASADLVWDGDGSGNVWDDGTTPNWDNDGNVDVFYRGDAVSFNDSATSPGGTVTISEEVRPSSVFFSNATSNYTLAGSALNAVELVKEGAGSLTLLNDNTFEFSSVVFEGSLIVGNGTTGSVSGDLGVFSPGTLEFNLPDGSIYDNELFDNGTGTVVISGPGLLELGNASIGFAGLLQVNSGTLSLSVASSLEQASIEVASGAVLESAAVNSLLAAIPGSTGDILIRSGGTLSQLAATTSNISPALTLEGGATLTSSIAPQQFGSWTINNAQSSGTTAPVIQVLGGSGPAVISAPLVNVQTTEPVLVLDVDDVTGDSGADLAVPGTFGAPFHTGFGLEIQGGGTVSLEGSGSFTGGVNVASGGLILAAGAELDFVIGANGVSSQVTGAGTASLQGAFDLDLSAADITPGNSWLLVDVSTLTETFDPTFSLLGFTETDDVHTFDDGTSAWTFTEATGELTVAPSGGGTPFEQWLNGFPSLTGADRDPSADPEGDGSPNLIEFVTGGDPTLSDTDKAPQGQIVGDIYVFSFNRPDEIASSGVNVIIEVGTTLTNWPDVFEVGTTTGTSSPGVTIIPNGAEPDTVLLGLPLTGNSVRFARLVAEEEL